MKSLFIIIALWLIVFVVKSPSAHQYPAHLYIQESEFILDTFETPEIVLHFTQDLIERYPQIVGLIARIAVEREAFRKIFPQNTPIDRQKLLYSFICNRILKLANKASNNIYRIHHDNKHQNDLRLLLNSIQSAPNYFVSLFKEMKWLDTTHHVISVNTQLEQEEQYLKHGYKQIIREQILIDRQKIKRKLHSPLNLTDVQIKECATFQFSTDGFPTCSCAIL